MSLTDQVREECRSIAESARFVSIDLDRLAELDPGPPPELDAERHYLEGAPEDVADYMLVARLDQLRVGLVSDAAEAAGDVRLLHRRGVACRSLALCRAVVA